MLRNIGVLHETVDVDSGFIIVFHFLFYLFGVSFTPLFFFLGKGNCFISSYQMRRWWNW